jgi:alanyl-tRNA synthetase
MYPVMQLNSVVFPAPLGPMSALIVGGQLVQKAARGQRVQVITPKSPFFIVGGGQVPDFGHLEIHGQRAPLLSVRYIGNAIGAEIEAPVDIAVGDMVTSMVDKTWRTNAMKNHTATHLLQAALMQVLGKNIKQSGSLVHPDYLRFDFTYHENPTPEQLKQVEDIVNEKIRENIAVSIESMSMKEAIAQGAVTATGLKRTGTRKSGVVVAAQVACIPQPRQRKACIPPQS